MIDVVELLRKYASGKWSYIDWNDFDQLNEAAIEGLVEIDHDSTAEETEGVEIPWPTVRLTEKGKALIEGDETT